MHKIHIQFEQAVGQSEAEKAKEQEAQEKANKAERAKNTQREITNLLTFRKRNAYA